MAYNETTQSYDEYPLSKFPGQICDAPDMVDVSASSRPYVDQYNTAWLNNDTATMASLVEEHPDVEKSLFNAKKINIAYHELKALQTWTKEKLLEATANAVGIKDDATGDDKLINTYSASKIDEKFNLRDRIVTVTFLKDNWSGTEAPYTQTVTASEISSSDEPALFKYKDADLSYDENKAYNKAFGFISDGIGDCGDGSVTWACYKKPAIDITIALKGV